MGLSEAQKKERSEYLDKNLEITECSRGKPYVYISYACEDWKTVFQSAVEPMQKQSGLRVYADRAFSEVNDKWIVPMLRNVRGADMMVVFVSQNYIENYACFLEFLTAVNNRKQIVLVSLEQQLHLADTTDLPDIEQGIKKEILKQGANIATNTNNTSNDVMRAMKSAFTSISTLLEMDVLSKYDISDAFINFFRDASINQKTINDLNAVRGTIQSISRRVFGAPPAMPVPLAAEAVAAEIQEDASVIEPGAGTQPVPGQPEHIQSPEAVPPEPVQPSEVGPPEPVQPSEVGPPELVQPSEVGQPEHIQSPEAVPPEPVQPPEAGQLEPVQRREAEPPVQESAPGCSAQSGSIPPVPQSALPESAFEDSGSNAADAELTASGSKRVRTKMALAAGTVAGLLALTIIVLIVRGLSGEADTIQLVEDFWYTSGDGDAGRYTGRLKDGEPDGQGTMVWEDPDTWEDGDIYEGEWKDGRYNGKGTLRYVSGMVYEGDWEDGYLTYGKATYNGTSYEGGWKEGYMHGEGVMHVQDEVYYKGTWENNKFIYGTMVEKDGSSYEGEWKDGKCSGTGTYFWAESGNTYTGEWKEGFCDGYGTMKYANGDAYEGEWKEGRFNGEGTYRYSDGTVRAGMWEDGRLAE